MAASRRLSTWWINECPCSPRSASIRRVGASCWRWMHSSTRMVWRACFSSNVTGASLAGTYAGGGLIRAVLVGGLLLGHGAQVREFLGAVLLPADARRDRCRVPDTRLRRQR